MEGQMWKPNSDSEYNSKMLTFKTVLRKKIVLQIFFLFLNKLEFWVLSQITEKIKFF